jgi:hypothetical protein
MIGTAAKSWTRPAQARSRTGTADPPVAAAPPQSYRRTGPPKTKVGRGRRLWVDAVWSDPHCSSAAMCSVLGVRDMGRVRGKEGDQGREGEGQGQRKRGRVSETGGVYP